jgi:hypothetical protein
MTVIGYARVSTTDQDLSIQETALKAAGCEVIRARCFQQAGPVLNPRLSEISIGRFTSCTGCWQHVEANLCPWRRSWMWKFQFLRNLDAAKWLCFAKLPPEKHSNSAAA